MSSYQNDDGKGVYAPINGSGTPAKSKTWLIAGVIFAIIGTVCVTNALNKPAGGSIEDAMKLSGIPLAADGSVLLFDKLSK